MSRTAIRKTGILIGTMSLKISNRATPKQIQILKDLEYYGKWDLSTDEAGEIITALWEEQRLEKNQEQSTFADWYNQGKDE